MKCAYKLNPVKLYKHFQKMATAGSDHLVGKDLEDLYELLEGGFLEGDIYFGRKLDSVMDEGEIEEKGIFKCEICGKECVSSRGLKRHQGMKHKNDKALPEKVSKLTASEFSSLVKRCSSICQHGDIRYLYDVSKIHVYGRISEANLVPLILLILH